MCRRTLANCVLKILDFFVRWSDAVSAVELLEIESLEDEASVKVLALVLHGDLLQEVVPVGV